MLSLFTFLLSALFFFFNATATPEIYTLSLHDALPISACREAPPAPRRVGRRHPGAPPEVLQRAAYAACERSEEHTSELQSLRHLVCRLLLEKKKKQT